MTVSIDENILIAAAIGIFVPLFIFFIKLIVEIGKMQTKLENMMLQLGVLREASSEINDLEANVKIINMRLDTIEREIRRTN